MFTCWLILLQPIRLLMMIVIMRWVHLHFGSQDLRLTKFLVRLFEGLGLSVSVGGLDGQFNLWNGRSFHHHPLWCGEDTAPGAASDALSAVHNRHDLTTGHLVNGGMDRQDSDRTQIGLRWVSEGQFSDAGVEPREKLETCDILRPSVTRHIHVTFQAWASKSWVWLKWKTFVQIHFMWHHEISWTQDLRRTQLNFRRLFVTKGLKRS